MKRVTASDARREWFRLLDEVADGEVVTIMRNGRRIIIRREDGTASTRPRPDYGGILRIAEPGDADRWSWGWDPTTGDVEPGTDQ